MIRESNYPKTQNSIQELVDTVDRLCQRLDQLAENEKNFCYNLQQEFERYSWDLFRISNNLKSIQQEMEGDKWE